MRKTRLSIIGTVGLPAKYGGFETLTEHLVENLNQKYDMRVYCSGKQCAKSERKSFYKGAKLSYLPLNANGIQSIPYDTLSIIHALFKSDVLLILGVAGAWILPFVRLFSNKKIIISIDGIEWKRDKWNWLAKWYLFWAESIAVKYSHIDISDNEAIQDYTAARYGSLSRIIEYGGDHTIKVAKNTEAIKQYPFLEKDYAFKVCRIEPENNVHVILSAFSKNKNLPLVIVGNWNNSEYGIELKNKYQNQDHIHLLDPIYNQEKLDVLRSNAALYIHGHSAGGTNPSLVEAMYLGLPILAYGVSYNRVTTENKAHYFYREEEINSFLVRLDKINLKACGNELEKIAHLRYTWEGIANRYQLLVEEAKAIKNKNSIRPKFSKVEYKDLITLGEAHLHNQYKF